MNRRRYAIRAPAVDETAPLAPGVRPFVTFTRVAADLPMALRRRALASLPFVLAVLLALPIITASHDGQCPAGEACPMFAVSTHTIEIGEDAGLDITIPDLLPLATDDQEGILVYELWDPEDEIVQGNSDQIGYGDEVAQVFDLVAEYGVGENGQGIVTALKLKTKAAYDFEIRSRYEFMLVACDGNYYRDHVHVTVNIGDVNEQPGKPDPPAVEGVSTTKLAVRWTAPTNTGPPITDYDLEYRQESAAGDWLAWSHSGPRTHAVIMSSNLMPDTDYEVRVLARNPEGDSPWSEPGTGRTKSATGNPPVFLESMPERSFVLQLHLCHHEHFPHLKVEEP